MESSAGYPKGIMVFMTFMYDFYVATNVTPMSWSSLVATHPLLAQYFTWVDDE